MGQDIYHVLVGKRRTTVSLDQIISVLLSTTLSGELWFDLDRRTGMKTTRIPHAPSTPLPELAEFLAPFRAHFHRSEGAHSLERYLTGLLTEHPNKNCDTLAQVVPGTSE